MMNRFRKQNKKSFENDLTSKTLNVTFESLRKKKKETNKPGQRDSVLLRKHSGLQNNLKVFEKKEKMVFEI
jgi:hypothetical protein